MCKISVIIPVYNTEKYIKKCLDSVVHSMLFEQCEVIIIDDGSVDASVNIIERFLAKHDNIKLYCFENGGLSVARNRGMSLAKGKYIFFLDSDDYLQHDYLYQLYVKAEETDCDIIFAGFSISDENETAETKVERDVLNNANVMNGCEYLNLRMDKGDWHNQVWCAMYKREFFMINNIKFKENIKVYEDILFTNQALIYAKKVCAIPTYGYMYKNRKDSLVHCDVTERDIIACINILDYFVESYNMLDCQQKKAFGRVLFELISMTLYYIGVVNPDNKRKLYQYLSTSRILKILRYSITNLKERIKYFIFQHFICLYFFLVKKKPKPELFTVV